MKATLQDDSFYQAEYVRQQLKASSSLQANPYTLLQRIKKLEL